MENKIFHYLITESSHNLNAYQNLKPTLFHHFGAIKSAYIFAYVIILPTNPKDEEAIRSWNRVRYSHRSVFCDMPQARRLPHGSQNLSV